MGYYGFDWEPGGSKGGRSSSTMISPLKTTAPYYQRNRAHPCSFYARGICNRGAECPYRHETPQMLNDVIECRIGIRV